MKRYLLCALAAGALALNVEAKEKDKEKEKYKDKDGTTFSVPDTGATVALLGLSAFLVVLAHRRFATTD